MILSKPRKLTFRHYSVLLVMCELENESKIDIFTWTPKTNHLSNNFLFYCQFLKSLKNLKLYFL